MYGYPTFLVKKNEKTKLNCIAPCIYGPNNSIDDKFKNIVDIFFIFYLCIRIHFCYIFR